MEPVRIQFACPHCAATNRVPAARIDDAPVCGRCGKPLLQGQPLNLTDADFDAVVGATRLPVLVDFWPPGAGPARPWAPAFSQAGHQLAGRALLVKVDSDANPQLSARFGIRSIPTLGAAAGRQGDHAPVGRGAGGRHRGAGRRVAASCPLSRLRERVGVRVVAARCTLTPALSHEWDEGARRSRRSVLPPLPPAVEGWGEGGVARCTLTPALSHAWEREPDGLSLCLAPSPACGRGLG